MDSVMTHLQTALAMGEDIVDRNPNFCMTSEWRETRVLGTKQHPRSAR